MQPVIIYTNVANQVPTFRITKTNLYVPVVTLSTQDNAKVLPQLKSGFKRTIGRNKYVPKSKLKSLSSTKFTRSKLTFCFSI